MLRILTLFTTFLKVSLPFLILAFLPDGKRLLLRSGGSTEVYLTLISN